MHVEETVQVITHWAHIISISILMSLCENTVRLSICWFAVYKSTYFALTACKWIIPLFFPTLQGCTSLWTNYQTRERMLGTNSHPVIPLMHPIFGYIPGNVLFHLSSLRFLILTPFPLSYRPDLRRTWSAYPYSVRPRHQAQLIKHGPHQLMAQLIPLCVPIGKLQTGCAFLSRFSLFPFRTQAVYVLLRIMRAANWMPFLLSPMPKLFCLPAACPASCFSA